MKAQTPQNPQTKIEQLELKFKDVDKIFVSSEGSILYSTSCDNALYALTDQNKLLIFEKNSTNKKYITIDFTPGIKKDESKLQTKENKTQIWCNDLGNHILIKHNGCIYYYNPYFKEELKLKEIELNYNSKYYLEPYSIAFNEEINSQDEFEILLSDYNSEIYDIKFKIIDKKDVKIEFFEKVHTFKSKFELEQEEFLEKDKETKDNEKEEDKNDIELDMDFDDINMISFEKGERIIDMKIYHNKNKNNENDVEKIIIACTKNMIFKFIGKEKTFVELFKKYSNGSEILSKSFRIFPNKSNSNNYNSTRLQILPSYTNTKNEKIVFGCMGGFGYCLGEIEDNIDDNTKNDNLSNIYVFNYRKPKYVAESKIPLFSFGDNSSSKSNLYPIMACQSKLHIFVLYDNCILFINKITHRSINTYKLSTKFIDMFYNKYKNSLYLYSNKEIHVLSLEGEEKCAWTNYVELGQYDLALDEIPKDDDETRANVHKLKADYLYKQKKYELAGKEYSLSNEHFEHICYKFLREGKFSGLISYLEMIKTYKLNDFNIRSINNELFINKYLVYTWLAELLLNEESNTNKNKNNELVFKKFEEEFKHNKRDRYINKQYLYHFLKINEKEKEFNEFAILKNDHKTLIQNLLIKGKYDAAFNYLEKNFINENKSTEECIKIFIQYIDLFMKKSIKNTIKLLESINFSENEQKELVSVLMGSNYKHYIENEDNYNIILNYLRKIIKQNASNDIQNKNLNNLYLLFLSLSDKKENQQEIVDYLKGPLNTYTLNNNHMNVSFTNKKVLIDLSFAEKILKKNPPALSLVYFLMQKYDESIKTALDNGENELAIFITQNIQNEEKQKKIWIKLFNFFKKDKKYSAKNILELSNGILKIEDIVPYMGDEIKLNDIKMDIQECIDVYEQGVSQLKQKIISYNKSNNNIQEDIYAINKRKIDLEHSKIKCHECQNNINDNKFFLFPCGHIFDADCLVKILYEYDANDIGGEDLKKKVQAVRNLSEKIMNMQRKKSSQKTNIFIGGFNKLSSKTKTTMKKFLNFVLVEQKGKENENEFEKIEKEKEKEKEKLRINEEESELTKEEETQLKELSKGLYNLLKEECVLCGNDMINSTQIKFSKEDENKKWGNLVEIK